MLNACHFDFIPKGCQLLVRQLTDGLYHRLMAGNPSDFKLQDVETPEGRECFPV
jgi:hypothetical protein